MISHKMLVSSTSTVLVGDEDPCQWDGQEGQEEVAEDESLRQPMEAGWFIRVAAPHFANSLGSIFSFFEVEAEVSNKPSTNLSRQREADVAESGEEREHRGFDALGAELAQQQCGGQAVQLVDKLLKECGTEEESGE